MIINHSLDISMDILILFLLCIGIKDMSNDVGVLKKWNFKCRREEVTVIRWIMLCKNTLILSWIWNSQYEHDLIYPWGKINVIAMATENTYKKW